MGSSDAAAPVRRVCKRHGEYHLAAGLAGVMYVNLCPECGKERQVQVEVSTARNAATCEKHGEYTSLTVAAGGISFTTKCPECTREADEANNAMMAMLNSGAQRRHDQLLEESGLSARHSDCTLNNFRAETADQVDALNAFNELAQEAESDLAKAPHIILLGHVGTGKTHLACGLIRALVPQRTVRRRKLAEIIRDLRASWTDRAAPSETQMIEHYGSVDLLIIEEIGVSAGSETELNQLFEIMDRRYESRLPTVLISNLKLDDVRQCLGDRVVDRLRGDKHFVIALGGPSQRKVVRHG
jgi:DNA replication protein DnaC